MQGKVCDALLILIKRAGEVVTRETLRERLWPTDTQINYDANVNTTVNKLRQVLGDSPDRPIFVETIPRKGYTFIANVEYVEKAAFADPNKSTGSAAEESGDKVYQGSKQLLRCWRRFEVVYRGSGCAADRGNAVRSGCGACTRIARSSLLVVTRAVREDLEISPQAQRVRVFTQSCDTKLHMFFERHAHFFGAFANVVAADAFCKRFIF